MRHFPKLSDPLIDEAFQELIKIEDTEMRMGALQSILRTLVHGDPAVVRTHLVSISDSWQRYVLLIELYAAHGEQRDLEQLTRVVIDSDADDVRDRSDQISDLRVRVDSGFRSVPMSLVITSGQREKLLARSKVRLERIRNFDVEPVLFQELCFQVELGDPTAVIEARALAGDSQDLVDQVNLSVANAHVKRASSIRARQSLQHIQSPVYRIEILTNIAQLESELGDHPHLSIVH